MASPWGTAQPLQLGTLPKSIGGGDEVCHNGKNWRTKWWTTGEEPGTTGQWGVWEEIGWCNGNTAPSISITAPLEGDTFAPGHAITLSAEAADTDGTVVQVEFFANGVRLGSDRNSPYAFSWEDVPEGSHHITAVATDDQGATGQSLGIGITVGNASSSAPSWDASTVYWGGDEVSHNGGLWRAKWWTTGEEQGTTGRWGVWEEIG